MQELSLDRSSRPETAVVSLLTFAALALLGCVLAYWTWAWFAPRPEPRASASPETGERPIAASALFGSAQRGSNAVAPTGIAIKLLGVVAASPGRRGYAVVEIEPRQVIVASDGQDITPGLRLAEVHADHVVLERNGARETPAWPNRAKAGAAAPRPAASPARQANK